MDTWKKWLITGVVFALFLVTPLVLNLGTYILNILVTLFIFIVLAQSWNLIGGYTGQINLGLAGFFGCGVLVTHLLWSAGVPFYVAIFASCLAALVLAAIISVPTLRLKGMYFAIGTLALAEVLKIVVGNIFTGDMQVPGSYVTGYSIELRYYIGLGAATIATVVVYFVVNSKMGLAMVAIRDNEEAALTTGVNVFKYKVLASLISALLTGLGGGVYGFFRLSYYNMSHVFNSDWTFEPLMAVIIGGTGTLIGPVLGSIFLVILREIFALTLGEAHLIIFGILFVLVVLYFPYGLVGSIDRIRQIMTRVGWSISKARQKLLGKLSEH